VDEDLVAELDRRIAALQARTAELFRQVEEATTAEAIIRMSRSWPPPAPGPRRRHLKAAD
jgi:hypothetical protein